MVDKYEVRNFITNAIGEEYLIPLLGVWDRFEDIDFSLLPNQFVLKCTHDSGGIVICKDKSLFDIEAARKKLTRCLKRNYFDNTREWPYKYVKPRIIAEQYMVDESGTELKDYKFFCFNGQPKFLNIISNRGEDTRSDFYDIKFNKIPVRHYYKNSLKNMDKPEGFEKMIELARKLSNGFIHLRIDFYNINGRVYFGELTFYQSGGFQQFYPEVYDGLFGSWINLPQSESITLTRKSPVSSSGDMGLLVSLNEIPRSSKKVKRK